MKGVFRILSMLMLLATGLLTPAAASAYVTENVIVVVLCGVRSSEFLLDPSRQYIPKIWNELRSKAVINTNMQTFSPPATGGGNFTLATGGVEGRLTIPFDTDYYRSDNPSFFEYFSKTLNLPADSSYLLAGGEDKVKRINHGLHPLYGSDYGATLVFPGGNLNSDIDTRNELFRVMDTNKPRLIYVLFKAADIKAHKNDWEAYLSAIQTQDQIIYDIWEKVEDSSFYKGKTAVIVTGDHGRHGDEHGGFQDHGSVMSDSDRIVPFIALGPDFRSGVVLNNTPRKLHDVVPTIGELLGFQTPFAEGRVMWELFKNANSLAQKGKVDESWPSHAVYGGVQHVVYQGTPRLLVEGSEDIRYFTVSSTGQKSTPVKLSESYQFSLYPKITASSSGLHMIYQGWLPTDGTYSNNYDWQHAYYRKSTDGGLSWSPGVRLTSSASTLLDTLWSEKSAIASSGDTVAVAVAKELTTVNTRVSIDGGASWKTITRHKSIAPRSPELVVSNSKIHMVLYEQEAITRAGGNTDIYYTRSTDMGTTWINRVRLTSTSTNDTRPHIAASGDVLHLVWESAETGVPQVFYRLSPDAGANWGSSVQISSNSARARAPRIAVSGSKIVVAWIDHREGTASNIYFKVSTNGGTSWSPDMKLTRVVGGFIRNFDLQADGGKFYYSWEENSSGVWKIGTRTM